MILGEIVYVRIEMVGLEFTFYFSQSSKKIRKQEYLRILRFLILIFIYFLIFNIIPTLGKMFNGSHELILNKININNIILKMNDVKCYLFNTHMDAITSYLYKNNVRSQ